MVYGSLYVRALRLVLYLPDQSGLRFNIAGNHDHHHGSGFIHSDLPAQYGRSQCAVKGSAEVPAQQVEGGVVHGNGPSTGRATLAGTDRSVDQVMGRDFRISQNQPVRRTLVTCRTNLNFMSTAPQTFSPRIEPTISRDVQRHLQLIYDAINNHAQSFQSLPKQSNPAPVTSKTFFPRISPSIPHEVQRHLQLIYGAINNHAVAFSQLPKVKTADAPRQVQPTGKTLFAHIEDTIPHEVQLHLQLIYGKLDNHDRAFEFYKSQPTAT
jgi:hypothetical protein